MAGFKGSQLAQSQQFGQRNMYEEENLRNSLGQERIRNSGSGLRGSTQSNQMYYSSNMPGAIGIGNRAEQGDDYDALKIKMIEQEKQIVYFSSDKHMYIFLLFKVEPFKLNDFMLRLGGLS